jgi:hypothetical protein
MKGTETPSFILEIENTHGDTLMRCEIDNKQRKIKTQNCSVADIDFVNDDTFDSDIKIRLQQDSEEVCNFSEALHEYEIETGE